MNKNSMKDEIWDLAVTLFNFCHAEKVTFELRSEKDLEIVKKFATVNSIVPKNTEGIFTEELKSNPDELVVVFAPMNNLKFIFKLKDNE